jgi:hypothetical protein
MGCTLCSITRVDKFGTEEDPVPNPFYCKTDEEREQFMEELAVDIATRHPDYARQIYRKIITDWEDITPEKEGAYWFYGWLDGRRKHGDGEPIEPLLDFIVVKKGVNCFTYGYAGNFQITGNVRMVGMWKPIEIPGLPDISALKTQ